MRADLEEMAEHRARARAPSTKRAPSTNPRGARVPLGERRPTGGLVAGAVVGLEFWRRETREALGSRRRFSAVGREKGFWRGRDGFGVHGL